MDENRKKELMNNVTDDLMTINDDINEVNEKYATTLIADLPVADIAALGSIFTTFPEAFKTMQMSSKAKTAGEGLYRCIFPKGITGHLFKKKGEEAFIGAIKKKGGGLAQARLIPVKGQAAEQAGAAAMPVDPATILIAASIIAIAKEIHDIKKGQKEIVDILERDKKSQLLADYEILIDSAENYKYYWNNENDVVVRLNQVRNIQRNSKKDIKSYSEELRERLKDGKSVVLNVNNTAKIRKILDRVIRYKLALTVYSFSVLMDVMISENYDNNYLEKVIGEIRELDYEYRIHYSEVYEMIEKLKSDSIKTKISGTTAKITKGVGNAIGKVPVIKEGKVDELLIASGEALENSGNQNLQQLMDFVAKHKESGAMNFVKKLEMINTISNKPVEIDWSEKVIRISEIKKVS